MNIPALKPLKAVALGALSGALVFIALRAMADPRSLTVRELRSNVRAYIGTEATITGLAYNIRSDTQMKNGQNIAYTKLSVTEVDDKNRRGKSYVFVSIPTSAFRTMPAEGDPVAITGTLQWSDQIAQIKE